MFSFFPILIILFTVSLLVLSVFILLSKRLKKTSKIVFSVVIIFLLCILAGTVFYSPEKDLGNGFRYHEDYRCIFSPDNIPDIVPKILWYKTDKKYITAKQRPRKEREYLYHYNENYSYSEGLDADYYWLVLKVERKVFGPLTYDKFILLCNKYEVDEKLIGEYQQLKKESLSSIDFVLSFALKLGKYF